jgi:hypothetical protein
MIARFTSMLALLSLIAAIFIACPTHAQGDADARRDRIAQLEKQWVSEFEAKDFAASEASLNALIELQPTHELHWYNLACVRCQLNKTKLAREAMEKSIDLGFADFGAMEKDEHLACLRDTDWFKQLIARAGQLADATIDKRIDRYKKGFAKQYAVEKDEAKRLAYMNGLDARALATAREEIDRINTWWTRDLLARDPKAPIAPTPWVLVMLPTRADYQVWARKNFGDRAENIGGIYDNSKKELVSRDLGPTFRHEFLHILHWRHMNELGQLHPVWVQEGLCSLIEDVAWNADGSAKPLPSWRTNMLKRLASAAKPPAWTDVLKMSQEKFSGDRPLAHYAMARSMFLYLHAQGKLGAWYQHYTANFAADPTGGKSFEAVLEKPIKQIETEWRKWLKELPEVAEENRPSKALLPMELSETTGDGLVVQVLIGREGRDSGLKVRDVITSINAQGVHELNEVFRILGDLKPGDEVTVAYRRGKVAGEAKVKLVRRE